MCWMVGFGRNGRLSSKMEIEKSMDNKMYLKLACELKNIMSSLKLLGKVDAGDIISEYYLLEERSNDPSYEDILSWCKKRLYGINKAHGSPVVEIESKTRWCSKCKEVMPASNFYTYKSGEKVVIDSKCKTCRSIYAKEWRKKKGEEFLERERLRKKEYRSRAYVKKVYSSEMYKEKRNAYRRKRYKENIERERERARIYQAHYRKTSAVYKERSKERSKKYWQSVKNDPEKLAAHRKRDRIASKKRYHQKKEVRTS